MRRGIVAAVLLVLFFGGRAAGDVTMPMVVLVEWVHASYATGLGGDGMAAGAEWPVWVDSCHRRIWVDLLYEPSDANVTVGGNVVAVPYTFHVELAVGSQTFARDVASSGYSQFLGEASEWGNGTFSLRLERGALVDWSLRVRGWEVPGEASCTTRVYVNEVEANPAGVDAGNEWIEVYNPSTFDLDLTGWFVESTHGVANRLELPEGSWVPRMGYRSFTFPTQFLDNTNESVRLLDPTLTLQDASAVRSDGANDAKTWQRVPDGSADWQSRSATREDSNGS